MREVDADTAGIVLGLAAGLPQQIAVSDDRRSVLGQNRMRATLIQQSVDDRRRLVPERQNTARIAKVPTEGA